MKNSACAWSWLVLAVSVHVSSYFWVIIHGRMKWWLCVWCLNWFVTSSFFLFVLPPYKEWTADPWPCYGLLRSDRMKQSVKKKELRRQKKNHQRRIVRNLYEQCNRSSSQGRGGGQGVWISFLMNKHFHTAEKTGIGKWFHMNTEHKDRMEGVCPCFCMLRKRKGRCLTCLKSCKHGQLVGCVRSCHLRCWREERRGKSTVKRNSLLSED